jgi:hypothetical protein
MKHAPKLRLWPLLTLLLAACGGSDLPAGMAPVGRAEAPVAVAGVAPLLADDGSVLPSAPQAVPADGGAQTRAGRYATQAQARQLEQAMPEGLLRYALVGSDADAIAATRTQVGALLKDRGLPADAPVLIEGTALRASAALVDQLAEAGIHNTWLVTR